MNPALKGQAFIFPMDLTKYLSILKLDLEKPKGKSMLEAITGKVFATIATLSVFLFSSYTGNDPAFRNLNSRAGENYLQLRTTLVSAFENDFPDVFKSGSTIPVNFQLTIRNRNRILLNRNFQNSVRYDVANAVYEIRTGGMNRKIQTSSYAAMLSEVSGFECSVPYQSDWGTVTVSLEAALPSVRFEQLRKSVDLMVLWKYQKPKVSATLNLKKVS
jgi:hypothetical protein